MKRLKNFLFLLVLVVLVVSCAENPGTTTMKLILSTSSAEGSRTILPGDSTLMDVTKYSITGTGPNGKTFVRNTDNTSVEIEGLTIGEWTVSAKGMNREGTVLVSGTKTFRLTSTPTPQTVVLDTLVGSGNFSYVLDWSLCDVANPQMDIFLTGPEMTGEEVPLAVTINTDNCTATVSETLSSGSYKIRVILKDGEAQVAGLVEAVRITNGIQTSGSHVFHFSELGPSTLTYFRDATGTPIKGNMSVSGNPASFLGDCNYTFMFSFTEPEKVNAEGLTIDWYYDGNLLRGSTALSTSGNSIEVNVKNGVHRVDAVVYNKLLGSTGSASYTFTVVPDGEIGEMALINSNAGLAIPMIDEKTIISPLPGNMFLVTNPNSAKMYICSISSGGLLVLKTYDSNNFPWLQNTKHVFSDTEMNIVLATDNTAGQECYTVLYFNSTNKTLTPVPGMRGEGRDPDIGRDFINFSAAAFSSFADRIILCDTNSTGHDYYFLVDGNNVALDGVTRKKNSSFYNVCDVDFNSMGTYYTYCSKASSAIVVGEFLPGGGYSNSFVSQSANSAISKVRFVNDQTIVAANSSELTTFRFVAGAQSTKYKTIGISMVDIQADGSNYFYVADNDCRLVSFEATGNEVIQLGATLLDNRIRSICLSGRYLAALTEANTIALFEVIE